jgi:hypothetical protein
MLNCPFFGHFYIEIAPKTLKIAVFTYKPPPNTPNLPINTLNPHFSIEIARFQPFLYQNHSFYLIFRPFYPIFSPFLYQNRPQNPQKRPILPIKPPISPPFH